MLSPTEVAAENAMTASAARAWWRTRGGAGGTPVTLMLMARPLHP